MTDTPYKKKLIEVSIPLDAINTESAREKAIRQAHPSTLHMWWARRPLAACRAVLFSQLVDDPSAHPDKFPTEEAQEIERQRLFEIIEDLVKWENVNDETVLERARREIRASCGGEPPAILDPFAGGGSIPLEAQRLGLEAHASDLNPVAVLINKAMIEIPPRWRSMKAVHPEADNRGHWTGAEGLAEDVRCYGKWMRDEAERRIGHLYPKVTLPDGSKANVIAWIWVRTVTCPNPACGATMPLTSTFWLSKKKGKESWIRPIPEGDRVRFEIGSGIEGPPDPPKTGRGGNFRCLCCEEVAEEKYVKVEGKAGRMGQQLMAVVAEGERKRVYLPPTDDQVEVAVVEEVLSVPGGSMPNNPRWFSPPAYGMAEYTDLFTNRQLVALTAYSDLVGEARFNIVDDAQRAGFDSEQALVYGDSVATYLALGVSRLTDRQNSLCRWENTRGQITNLFSRQAIPMVWDFAEAGLFSMAAGDYGVSLGSIIKVLKRLPATGFGLSRQVEARATSEAAVVATDPPYYDNIGYADLSDFFYVWLRRSLKDVYPDLFATMVTPKADELIATPYRHGGSKAAAEQYFEDGFVEVFERCREVQPDGFPMTLFYAFKQTETGDEGNVSTGWSTMLEGLVAAGWMVTATWPMRTEMANKIGMKANMLASSIVLTCRPRSESSGITDRQGLMRALREELPGPLHELQKASIAPVDLRQAAIGPGMAVFSRFARVVEPDGEPMRVRTALGLINQVLDQVLNEQDTEFDSETRWAIQWFTEFFEDEGPYGKAEQLATSMDVTIDGMVRSGILKSGEGKVRLLSRDEMPADWDPRSDLRTPIWEACQHLVWRLETDGEESAARLLRDLGGVGESAHLLAYRLYTICETKRPQMAGAYNALVSSWSEIQRISRQVFEPATVTEQSTLDL